LENPSTGEVMQIAPLSPDQLKSLFFASLPAYAKNLGNIAKSMILLTSGLVFLGPAREESSKPLKSGLTVNSQTAI
jgi:hypothetical protein